MVAMTVVRRLLDEVYPLELEWLEGTNNIMNIFSETYNEQMNSDGELVSPLVRYCLSNTV